MINTRKQLNFSSFIPTQVIIFSLCQLMHISRKYSIAIVLLLSFMYGGCGNSGGRRNSTDSQKVSSHIVPGDMENGYGEQARPRSPPGDWHIPSLQTMSISRIRNFRTTRWSLSSGILTETGKFVPNSVHLKLLMNITCNSQNVFANLFTVQKGYKSQFSLFWG